MDYHLRKRLVDELEWFWFQENDYFCHQYDISNNKECFKLDVPFLRLYHKYKDTIKYDWVVFE